jgi:hypothetical protein
MYAGVNLSRGQSHPVVQATIPRGQIEHTFSPPLKPKKTYQFKALLYKAYWNQKRQIAVNICCLGLCPFLIVFLSAAMGAFTSSILKSSVPSGERSHSISKVM